MCSLIWLLIWFNPMTTPWYPSRHRCQRRLKKISQTVVCTWSQLLYYLCCLWLHFWPTLNFLRDWHGHDQMTSIQNDKPIYIKYMEYYLHDVTELPHILLNPLFSHLSIPNWSLMNHAICVEHTLRSVRSSGLCRVLKGREGREGNVWCEYGKKERLMGRVAKEVNWWL